MTMIKIENLGYRFSDGSWGLQHINLTIEYGEFVVIAGANGSGKTTLLRHLNGLLQPSKGAIQLDGHDIGRDRRRARQVVGMVFQDADSQIVGETVYDDVAFGPENLCLPVDEIKRRVALALKAVGLFKQAQQRPHLLSGGEKRRLAIAGVLAMKPQVLALDEPFANLDFPGTTEVLKQILFLHRAGHTIVVATHDVEKVIAHADRVIVLQKGAIVRIGAPADVMGDLEPFGVRQPCAARLGLEVQPWLS
jgi:biotin transport system ATP-binding protein